MKVLFVCSGNSWNGIGAVVSNQADSLLMQGIDITYYAIKGKGLTAYLKHSYLLRKYLRNQNFDIVHAHYALSAFTATLAGCKPLVVSLMGSDAQAGRVVSWLIRTLSKKWWARLVVKSVSMKDHLNLKAAWVIPNGVDLSTYISINDDFLRQKYGFSANKCTILFLANPSRKEKNIVLAMEAFGLLSEKNVELQVRFNLPKDEVPEIINAADVILLTSLWEGSPNVIKEAMACSKPIVATNVGDISWLFGDAPGHFITSFEPMDVAEKIMMAVDYTARNMRPRGRERIVEFGLDSQTVAKRIISLYQSVLDNAR